MTQYYAVLDNFDRRGPFHTMREPVNLIKKASKDLGHTKEEAQQFFLHQTAVEQVDVVNGKPECFRLGWQAREASGVEEEATDESQGTSSRDEIICGSGVGVSIAANKVEGVRACLINETFSAHQGVEDDDMNIICLGGLVVGHALAWELVQTFLSARFSGAERHRRRRDKVASLDNLRLP